MNQLCPQYRLRLEAHLRAAKCYIYKRSGVNAEALWMTEVSRGPAQLTIYCISRAPWVATRSRAIH